MEQKFLVVDAETFLFAIKNSFDGQFDVEALEWLVLREKRIFKSLNDRRITGTKRDRMILYQGMLDGVMLNVRKMVLLEGTKLRDANKLTEGNKVKEEN